MLFDKLSDYYGCTDDETEDFVHTQEKNLTAEEQAEIYSAIIQKRSKRYGFPDIAALSEFFKKRKDNAKTYSWCVCKDCKAEYALNFISCPSCYKKDGKRNKGYTIRMSDTRPGSNVIMWNQTSFTKADENDLICLNCTMTNVDGHYCYFFGDPNHVCSNERFNECPCKACCVRHKKANAHLKRD